MVCDRYVAAVSAAMLTVHPEPVRASRGESITHTMRMIQIVVKLGDPRWQPQSLLPRRCGLEQRMRPRSVADAALGQHKHTRAVWRQALEMYRQ